jgi:glycine hydroxymethyltransferase
MEMGGERGLGVAEAGFGYYVKVYKLWFVGRDAYIAREKTRKGVVVRFRFNEKGVRRAHYGDPVLDQKGRIIGVVTSCSIGSEGFLIGQAFVEFKSCEEGTPILIYPGAPKNIDKAPVDLTTGDRFTLPALAVILRRFPKFT